MSKIKKIFTFFLVTSFLLMMNLHIVFAKTDYVLLGGDSIGLKFSTGVTITGKFQVETKNGKVSPWKSSDLEIGDRIVDFDHQPVSNNESLLKYLSKCKDSVAILTLRRGNQEFDTNIQVTYTKNNEKTIGLYIKDQIVGVGTLTYIDENSSVYASLGHGIFDTVIPVGEATGNVVNSVVETIKKGVPGTPGEKRAVIERSKIGSILVNEVTGVYGVMENYNPNRTKLCIASQREVKKGKATMYTVINQNKIVGYDIMILDVNIQNERGIKGLKIKVIDNELIKAAGGIVQGMSGSPIVQNGKLVGAVSHVTVDNPLIGYAVHIEWMNNDVTKLAKQMSLIAS